MHWNLYKKINKYKMKISNKQRNMQVEVLKNKWGIKVNYILN